MSLLVKHFVTTPKALANVHNLNIDQTEKQKLAEMVMLVYHQKLLNKFLEILSEEDKKLFMESFLGSYQEESFSFLREKIENIEKVVEESIVEIEEKLHEDFEELKGI